MSEIDLHMHEMNGEWYYKRLEGKYRALGVSTHLIVWLLFIPATRRMLRCCIKTICGKFR